PVKRSRVSDEVVVQLTRMIVQGTYPAGERLPPERSLAKELGVTRTTLREALRKLEGMGLIAVRQGDGIYARDHTVSASLEFVRFLVMTGIDLDPEFMLSLEEARRIFALKLVELAAERIDEEGLERLEAIVREYPKGRTPELLSGELDFRLYHEIAKATRNRAFVAILNSLREMFGLLRWLYAKCDDEAVDGAAALNVRLVAALRSRDAEAAVKILTERMDSDARVIAGLLMGGL
ncbi:FadR/GntR family transcriptional regulator, partial [Planctomycetota bacterium]